MKIKDIWGNMVEAPKGKPLYKKGDKLVFPRAVDKSPVTVDRVTTDAIGSEWYYIFKEIPKNPMSELRLWNSRVQKVEAVDTGLLVKMYEGFGDVPTGKSTLYVSSLPRSDGKYAVTYVFPISGKSIKKVITKDKLDQEKKSGKYEIIEK